MKKGRGKRLWIRDFRIPNTPDNRHIASLMELWRERRERPTHFTRAIKLYTSLMDNDLETFFEVLMEFAPRLAYQLMHQSSPKSERKPEIEKPAKSEKAKTRAVPKLEETQPSGDEQIDDLMTSLGLDDLEF
jgi:hypothetical protein